MATHPLTKTFEYYQTPVLVAVTLVLTCVAAWPALVSLWSDWMVKPAYSHGAVVLVVAAYLTAKRIPDLTLRPGKPSRWFLASTGLCLFVLIAAVTAELHVLAQYSSLGLLASLVIGTTGWQGIRILLIPLLLIFLSIPPPGYFETLLTADLKLLSSRLGAELLHLLGVPVFGDGNVIDLGTFHLQVADACSGLTYLFPLLAIGTLIAGFLETTFWQRVVCVLLVIPLTIAMNVVRISVTGMLVRYSDIQAAEGFLHAFEGWFFFMVSLALLFPAISLVLRIGSRPTTLSAALQIDLALPKWSRTAPKLGAKGRFNLRILASMLLIALILIPLIGARDRQQPVRLPFSVFPLLAEDWVGNRASVDAQQLKMLGLSDYLMASYISPQQSMPVDLFISYYAAQIDGATPHSPEICLPGSGWEIQHIERTDVEIPGQETTPVNRAVMLNGERQMLVYYWFPQRGRVLANEFAMKWYIFQDSITSNRTDGAFVRLTTLIDGTEYEADQRLRAFMSRILPLLPNYVPGSDSDAIKVDTPLTTSSQGKI